MKVIWITRIRNEEVIIKNTLDHMSVFCTWGVFVYDDASTDSTLSICKNHSIVKWIIEWKKHDSNRKKSWVWK